MRAFLTPRSRPRADDAGSLRRLANVHPGPLLAALALAIVGLMTIHSASAVMTVDYMPRQAVWLVLGLLVMLAAFSLDYHAIVDLAPFVYGAALALLIAVLFIGSDVAGHRSWIGIGSIGGQPSELAKPATVLLLARYLGRIQRRWLSFGQVAVAGAIAAVPMVLISLEGDLGSTAMMAPLVAAMLLVAGVRPRQLAAVALLGLMFGAAVWTFGLQEYQRQRITTFVSPDSDPLGAGYQVRQSKIAVGSGQWLGRGYGQGTQSQLRFLPARHTDFVMAVLAEERGFAGVTVVLVLYGLFIAACAKIALRSRDRTGILLVTGLLGMFSFHVLYNTAMVVGLVPITGIPLPFLSYGGSFTLTNFMLTGLVLNVDHRRYVNR